MYDFSIRGSWFICLVNVHLIKRTGNHPTGWLNKAKAKAKAKAKEQAKAEAK